MPALSAGPRPGNKKMTARQKRRRRILLFVLGAVCFLLVVQVWSMGRYPAADTPDSPFTKEAAQRAARRVETLESTPIPDWITPALLDMGGVRDGTRLGDFRGVVIHYVGNPGTTAMSNRNYFAMEGTTVCSHFVVGLDGEIVQCLPLWERSVASNQRNADTISVEVCHPDEGGQFTDATSAAVVKLTAWLCDVGGLRTEAVIRHYDVTGKQCPLYYVQHEDAWEKLRADIDAARGAQ